MPKPANFEKKVYTYSMNFKILTKMSEKLIFDKNNELFLMKIFIAL